MQACMYVGEMVGLPLVPLALQVYVTNMSEDTDTWKRVGVGAQSAELRGRSIAFYDSTVPPPSLLSVSDPSACEE
jgi:hypothetical protein